MPLSTLEGIIIPVLKAVLRWYLLIRFSKEWLIEK